MIGCFSYGRRSVGVAQHWMEGAGKVVGMVTAVVLLRHGHQAGQADDEEEEQLDGKRSPEDPQQEGLAFRGGGGRGDAILEVRTGGNAASGAGGFASAAGRHRVKLNTAENRPESTSVCKSWFVKKHLIAFLI